MATIYRRGGKRNKGGTYYIQYFDEQGRRRTVKGCKDKAVTDAIARKLEGDVLLRKQGIIDVKADKYITESNRPIADHVAAFHQYLTAKGNTQRYANKVKYRITCLFGMARIESLKDITPSSIQNGLGSLKENGKSNKTLNDYLAAVKGFCRWLRRDGRIPENPIDHLGGFNVHVDRRHDRRAFTDEELVRLFETTRTGRTLQRCSGQERALIYKLSALTGLRRNEIASLTKSSFHFDTPVKTVTVEAAFSKHRREDTLPLPEEIIPELIGYLRDKREDGPVFKVPEGISKMIKEDVGNAGIPYETKEGFADFHSLRHTFITRLVKSGVNIKTAQVLARHSDPRLTLGVYSHIQLIDQFQAIKKIPQLETGNEGKREAMATGTESLSAKCRHIVGSQASSSVAMCQNDTFDGFERIENKSMNSKIIDVVCRRLSSSGEEEEKTSPGGFEPPLPP